MPPVDLAAAVDGWVSFQNPQIPLPDEADGAVVCVCMC